MSLPPPPRRPAIVWDIVTSTVLLVVELAVAGVLTFFAFFLAFASDPCGAVACDYDRMGAGFFIALLGPGLVTVAAIVVAVILMARRRVGFWVPLVGIVLAVGVWFGGAALVVSGVPGSSL